MVYLLKQVMFDGRVIVYTLKKRRYDWGEPDNKGSGMIITRVVPGIIGGITV